MKQKIVIIIVAAAVLLSACSFAPSSPNTTKIENKGNQKTTTLEPQKEAETPNYHQNISLKKDSGICASKDEKVFLYTTRDTTDYVDMISAIYNEGYEIVDITIMDTANSNNAFSAFKFKEIYVITYRIPDA